MKNIEALVIVDMQAGFMPECEGKRLDLDGFGELGVEGAEQIVDPVNVLTHVFRSRFYPIATTQDWHPENTAHFSDKPNFINTWPSHCVAETPGSALHPDLLVAQHSTIAQEFVKGDVSAQSPEDDTSYTGALAHIPDTNTTLPVWLKKHRVTSVYVVGLALGDGQDNKLCVDSTAADLKQLGFDVSLVTDATEAVIPSNKELCLKNLGKLGIKLTTVNEVKEKLTLS